MEINIAASKRALLARARTKLTRSSIKWLLVLMAIALVAVGAFLCVAGSSWCWFVLSLAALPLAFQYWITHGLADLLPCDNDQTLAGQLESNLLGKLPPQPSPQDMADALVNTAGGNFFSARYGLTPDVIAQLSSNTSDSASQVWNVAYEMQQKIHPGVVTSATLAAALIISAPAVDDFLPRVTLDQDDIKAGVEWYEHIQSVIAHHNAPKKSGGFARDWAFGYTPLLERFGSNISQQITSGRLSNVELESHQILLGQIQQLLTKGARRNVALIGQLGVGKMTVVDALAESLLFDVTAPKELRYHQIVTLDASSLISAAPGRGQLEQLVNEVLMEAYSAKNIIICLDNAQLFFEEGVGSVDISNVLLPILEGGALRIILTMENQRWLQIGQRMPALTTAINRVSVDPPSKPETIRILQNQLLLIEYRSRVTYMYQALESAYDLGDRYVQEQAMPGKAIKILESAANFAQEGFVTDASVRQVIEQTVGVKVGSADSSEERETLLHMEQFIHKRMIGQTRAVQVVSDALRRARSGVRNQNRPIGTFLFLGPTGVGKTELSKALAEVYFGGQDRLLRVDLNEYVRSEDVVRLIADASTNEHSLAAQIARQPFSVVLLDEIEKAHPDVLTTLLQVLDEGVLRDINGREINCKDSIIIATSNAGAQQIRAYIEAGTPLGDVEKQLTDELIKNGDFRPEFLNRFDEIVVFTPLQKPELRQIIDLILQSLNKNLSNQKIVVEVADDAKDLLVDAGYDPQLGARPMRRVVQRAVENTVARRMLEGSAGPGQTITLSSEDTAKALERP